LSSAVVAKWGDVPLGPTTPPLSTAGDIVIVAVLPDPVGPDRGHEVVTLLITTATVVDLTDWALIDAAGARNRLDVTIAGGAVTEITASNSATAVTPWSWSTPPTAPPSPATNIAAHQPDRALGRDQDAGFSLPSLGLWTLPPILG
jgi:hypothetical protein